MKKKARMKLVFAVCCLLMCVSLLLGGCSSDNPEALQEKFLNDMAEGLQERLENANKDTSQMTPQQRMSHYEKGVKLELKYIEKYKDKTFADGDFDLLAHEYINACLKQLESLEYFIVDNDYWLKMWDEAFAERARIIIILYDEYQLPIKNTHLNYFEARTDSKK